jgi:hypothetical protein
MKPPGGAVNEGRFTDSPKGTERLPMLHMLVRKPSAGVGLSGLPPGLTHPDSPAGRYYRSQGKEVGFDLVPASVPNPQSLPWQAAISALLASWGAEVLSLQQNNDQEKGHLRIDSILRFPNGEESEFKMSLVRQKKGKNDG